MILSLNHKIEIEHFVNDKILQHKQNPLRSKLFRVPYKYELYLRCYNHIVDNQEKRFIVISRIQLNKRFRGKGHFSKLLEFLDSINSFDGLFIESANPLMQTIAIHKGFRVYAQAIETIFHMYKLTPLHSTNNKD